MQGAIATVIVAIRGKPVLLTTGNGDATAAYKPNCIIRAYYMKITTRSRSLVRGNNII